MKIAIVGSGYVGLVTGTCLAELGIDVCCIDIDTKKIEMLKKGISPIYEQGLEDILNKNIDNGKLTFATSIAEGIKDVEIVFSAVGTPPDEDGSADLKYVLDVASEIGKNIEKYMLIVTKSTVPVGTANKIKATIAKEIEKRGKNIGFDVASNPEFLKEGSAIEDFMHPDRIVVGIESNRARDLMAELYKSFTSNGHSLIFMDIPSAEMTKYAANSMLATRISFMNDIANLCELVGANINSVKKGIGSDSRIGYKFLNPGIGYGGSCFPKDVKALIKTGSDNNYSLDVLKAVENVNENQKQILFNKFTKHFKGNVKDKTIAFWGLAFKPGTDDMREAPSLVLIELLLEAGCKIKAFDPVSMPECERKIGNKITYCNNMYEAAKDVDAIFLLTEWGDFSIPRWEEIGNNINNKLIFDGRNLYNKDDIEKIGFIYYGIG